MKTTFVITYDGGTDIQQQEFAKELRKLVKDENHVSDIYTKSLGAPIAKIKLSVKK